MIEVDTFSLDIYSDLFRYWICT